MLDYTNTRVILEIAEGKSALKPGPITQDGIAISKDDEIRYGVQFSVNSFKVVGFASSKTWMLAYYGDISDYAEADDEDKTTPARTNGTTTKSSARDTPLTKSEQTDSLTQLKKKGKQNGKENSNPRITAIL